MFFLFGGGGGGGELADKFGGVSSNSDTPQNHIRAKYAKEWPTHSSPMQIHELISHQIIVNMIFTQSIPSLVLYINVHIYVLGQFPSPPPSPQPTIAPYTTITVKLNEPVKFLSIFLCVCVY